MTLRATHHWTKDGQGRSSHRKATNGWMMKGRCDNVFIVVFWKGGEFFICHEGRWLLLVFGGWLFNAGGFFDVHRSVGGGIGSSEDAVHIDGKDGGGWVVVIGGIHALQWLSGRHNIVVVSECSNGGCLNIDNCGIIGAPPSGLIVGVCLGTCLAALSLLWDGRKGNRVWNSFKSAATLIGIRNGPLKQGNRVTLKSFSRRPAATKASGVLQEPPAVNTMADDLYGDLDGTVAKPTQQPTTSTQLPNTSVTSSAGAEESSAPINHTHQSKLQQQLYATRAENEELKKNMGILYRTAKAELERKDRTIDMLQNELDSLRRWVADAVCGVLEWCADVWVFEPLAYEGDFSNARITQQMHNNTTKRITTQQDNHKHHTKTVNQTISISYSFRLSTKTIYRFYQWIQSPCKGVWKVCLCNDNWI